MACVFCKIVNKEIPSSLVYEDDKTIAFKDINPRAESNFLIVPKKHIESVSYLGEKDKSLAGELMLATKEVAKKNNCQSYKLLVNVGREAGQTVEHLHIHFLAGGIKEIP